METAPETCVSKAAVIVGTLEGPDDTARPVAPQALRDRASFRRAVTSLHNLGARPVAELLAETATAYGIEDEVLARLAEYAALDPGIVAALGAGHFPPAPIRRAA